MTDTEFDLATVDRLLSTTRAVRRRLDVTRLVPRSVIVECLRLATRAPTAGDAQNWRWVVVTDRLERAAIADVYREETDDYVRSRLAATGDSRERRRLTSVKNLSERLAQIPVHVLAFILDETVGGQGLPPATLFGSIFPAIWSFQLALRSRRLGTTPLYIENEAALATLVHAPSAARFASLLPVAYYTGDTFRMAPRRDVEEVLYWDLWGSREPQPKRPRVADDF
jgi:nitroreductase